MTSLLVLVAGLALCPIAAEAQYSLVSVAQGGGVADGSSARPSVSSDGRFVAFDSVATNLVAGDTNGQRDVFLRNLVDATTVRVSVGATGASGGFGAQVGVNGRFVLFTTRAAYVALDTNTCPTAESTECEDAYVYDADTQQFVRASLANDGMQANAGSVGQAISDDGRYVLFASGATNLVAGDTNGAIDLFVRDLTAQTTIRVNVSSTGEQMRDGVIFSRSVVPGRAELATAMSGDGQVVAFVSDAPNLGGPPDTGACDPSRCGVAYVHLSTGETIPYPEFSERRPFGIFPPLNRAQSVALDRTGRYLLVGARGNNLSPRLPNLAFFLIDRQDGRMSDALGTNSSPDDIALSGDGRFFVNPSFRVLDTPVASRLIDRETMADELLPESALAGGADSRNMHQLDLSGNGRLLTFISLTPGFIGQVYALDRDADNDGMWLGWEQFFGLDPADPADAGADPDGDGQTNLEESQAFTHPRGFHTRYFAEGADNEFFQTRFALFNPNPVPQPTASVVARYLGGGGAAGRTLMTIGPTSRGTIDVSREFNRAPNDFSTVIESDLPIVADRTMTWDRTRFGSHAETSVASPSADWFLAEGATHGAFDLFYLLQNPQAAPVDVTITYLRPNPLPPVVRTYPLAPNSRRTIWVDAEGPLLAATDVSAAITATAPIIVERAMYLTAQNVPFAGGHAGAGIPAAAPRWFLAEGATGDFFDMFVLVANPSATDAPLTVTYLLPGGVSFSKHTRWRDRAV